LPYVTDVKLKLGTHYPCSLPVNMCTAATILTPTINADLNVNDDV